jgi:hypothetical protein
MRYMAEREGLFHYDQYANCGRALVLDCQLVQGRFRTVSGRQGYGLHESVRTPGVVRRCFEKGIIRWYANGGLARQFIAWLTAMELHGQRCARTEREEAVHHNSVPCRARTRHGSNRDGRQAYVARLSRIVVAWPQHV